MADISHIKGPDNTSYDIKDATARSDLTDKISRSGDTMTGALRAVAFTALAAGSPLVSSQSTDVDASKADNNVSTDHYPGFSATDKFSRTLARMESVASSNGNIAAYWYVRNYNTSGSQVAQKGIKITMAKDGSITYTVDDNSKFRTAIDALCKSGDTMTGNLKLEGSSQPSVLFKESGYGDKFEIKPSFGGVDEANYLAIKTATGAAGIDPSTSDKIRIRPSGKLEFVNTSRNIEVPPGSISYVDGAKGNAGLYMPHTYNKDEWRPIMCVQTKTGGSWSIGNYNNDHLSFVKFTKANIDSSTNTMQCQIDLAETGSLETINGSIIARDSSNPASPSSGSLYGKGFYLRDAANDDYAYLRHHYSGAEKGLQIEVRRSVNGSYVYNTLNMRINASGGRTIQVSDGGSWRSAIGAQATLSSTSVSYTRVNGNVSNDAKCWRYGNVVVFTGYFGVGVSNLGKGTQLWNGFPQPKCDTYFHARCEGNRTSYDFYVSVNGGIYTNQANIPAGTYLVNVTWIC